MDQEPAQSGDKTSWDSEIIGFGVRVVAPTKRREEGAKSFFVNYRVAGRRKALHDRLVSRAERRGRARRSQGTPAPNRSLRRPHEGAEATPF
jgi:hypothetical protein